MDGLIAHFVPDKGWVGQSVHSGYTATSGYKLHGSHMLYGLYSTKPEGGGGGGGGGGGAGGGGAV